MEPIAAVFLGAGLGLAATAVFSAVARSLVIVCRPSEVVIFSGRRRKLADGGQAGYRVIVGGRAVRVPILEQVDRMSLLSIPVDLKVANAYSKGGIPLRVHAIANMKVASDPLLIGNAIERFLGRSRDEIARVARESLEGHLRGVLATLTPEEVNEDRLKFATALVEESGADFKKLGLQLDTLKVQNISDDVSYLASIGRARIAGVLRDAEMAEATSRSEAEMAEAESHRAGEVAVQKAAQAIAQKENDLKRVKAQMEAQSRAAEEIAQQSALEARAEAEQKLQAVRRQLEETRLTVEVVLPAEAQKEASELRARGEAATIEENGRALAEVLRLLTEVWAGAGETARDVYLIHNLEPLLRAVVDRVRELRVAEAQLLDSGSGTALARHVASYPATVRAVLAEIGQLTGVDVLGALAPRGSSGLTARETAPPAPRGSSGLTARETAPPAPRGPAVLRAGAPPFPEAER